MRHDYGRRPRILSESFVRRAPDHSGGPGHPGIDQHPGAVAGIRFAKKDDVDDCQSFVGDIGCYFPGVIVTSLVRFRVIGESGDIQRDLLVPIIQSFLSRERTRRRERSDVRKENAGGGLTAHQHLVINLVDLRAQD